mmetsp:Transcript_57059/g.121140  ORF Transcript_57059/g.121140 Transcript_57059/m.121140 type:complete len:114 (+) Transcript_57059:313-654(+)
MNGLMKMQQGFILEHVGKDGTRRDAWRSMLRLLGQTVPARRADVRRIKVKLKSMGADDDTVALGRSSPRDENDDGDDDTVADSRVDSRTALNESSIGNDDKEEVVTVFYRSKE